MMSAIQYFFSFSDLNLRNVPLGTHLLSNRSSSIIGVLAFVNRKTLISDAIGHAVLPGTCLAFFVTGDKSSIWLIISAFITGWLVSIAIYQITAHSKIRQDAAIAVVDSVAFGLGSF